MSKNGVTREFIGVFVALFSWWALALIIGLLTYAAFPASVPLIVGSKTSLDIQALPGDLIGFVVALYAFRGVTRHRDDDYCL